MDLPTKIVAEHLAARITDLEVELAEQAAGAVVEGLVFVDGVDKLPTAVAGVRTLAPSTAYYLTTEIDLEGDRLLVVNTSAWLNTGGLVLDGSIGTVAFFQTLWTSRGPSCMLVSCQRSRSERGIA